MNKACEWGEFFPAKYSPSGYNETVAQEYYPLSKERAEKEGFNYTGKLFTKSSPSGADPSKGIVVCKTCSKKFKVIPQEAEFYKRFEIKTPESCPDCRHFMRNILRNPRLLRAGTCSKCQSPIQTTYVKGLAPKLIYCEKCYLETLY